MPEHPDIVISEALEGLWAAIREQHPGLPAVPIRVLDLPEHRGLFVPSAMTIYVARWLVDHYRSGTTSVATHANVMLELLLHEAAHLWLNLRGAETFESGARAYHNPLFRDAAAMLGLAPPGKPDQPRGYADCVLTQDTVDVYAEPLRQFGEAVAA